MRPQLRFLSETLLDQILNESRSVLSQIGIAVENAEAAGLLCEYGAKQEGGRILFPPDMLQKTMDLVPHKISLYDVLGNQTHNFSGSKVHFAPGSSALNVLDYPGAQMRKPSTTDYVRYTRLVSRLNSMAAQSTAFVPSDIPQAISDCYRLYLSLLFCEKPVITGSFTVESVPIMIDFQRIVRGSEQALREKPLASFACCPTSPLKWNTVAAQNLMDCARAGVPVEIIPAPMAGFLSPVTMVGTLVQLAAETLSGIVLAQCARPGAPVFWGAAPSTFDVRNETAPMSSPEAAMLNCANNEVGKSLGIPTQAYIALSDAKALDAQAGMETSMGAHLAALSGINNVSGPGVLDFVNAQSLEKLVLDHEICSMALHMTRGIEPKEDFPSLDLFRELLAEEHLLISNHSRRYLRMEHYFTGSVVDRSNLARWQEEGSVQLWERAHSEVERLIGEYQPSRLDDSAKKALHERMQFEAKKHGMQKLPDVTL